LTDELTRLPAARLVALMRARAVSPVEVLEAHLERAERLNPRLNAVVTFAPDAVERARDAERAAMRADADDLPPLHGLPITIKDTIDTAALRTTSGSRARAANVPSKDATAVARLRAAGAIIYGKTNTSELALDYTTENPVFGRTTNPHDEARTPGGSSGGCAAAVAACLTPASLGSDMTGSIRVPAHFCGVAGLKPTAGAVPADGHFPPTEGACSLGASLGPIARTVEDLTLLFDALTNSDQRYSHPLNSDQPRSHLINSEQQQSHSDQPRSRPLNFDPRHSYPSRSGAERIHHDTKLEGLGVAFYTDDGVTRVSDETKMAVESAARALEATGCRVAESRPPGVERAPALWLALFSRAVRGTVRELYAGREQEAGAAARAMLERDQRERDATNAQTLEDFFAAWLERDRLLARLVEWMSDAPLLVAPVGAVAAFEHGARKVEVAGQEVGVFRAFSYAQTFNVFNLPVACVPAGRTREGLPVGVQIVGRPFAERAVLRAARAIEEALGGWQPPYKG
jgi:Asp-tRNA(Asn)/Glu-tRNA(Gln) amidotransferase A subunit family amidase